MKKTMAFLLILLCVLTLVITFTGNFLHRAIFGSAEQQSTQYALTLDESGLAYYVETLGGENRIVKVDDLGNIIVDEALPVMGDADRFVVQEMFITSDKYIYVAGFEIDQLNRTASRALLVVLDENGTLCALPLDQPINESAIRAPRSGAMFAAMSEDNDKVYFAYLNEGQIAVMAHDKLDTTLVEAVGYLTTKSDLTAMYVAPGGRIIACDANGGIAMGSSGTMAGFIPVSDADTFRFFHGNNNSVYLWSALDGGVKQINYEQKTISTIVGERFEMEDGRSFADLSQVAVSSRGRLGGMLYGADGYVVYTGSESSMTPSPMARRSVFNADRLAAAALLVGALLVTLLVWDIYCNILKMRVSVLLRQALLIGMAMLILCFVLLNVLLEPQLDTAMREQYEHQVQTAASVLASDVMTLDEEAYVSAVQGAQVFVAGADESYLPVSLALVQVPDLEGLSGALKLVAGNETTATHVAYNTLPFAADLNMTIRAVAEMETEAITRFRDALGDTVYAFAPAGNGLVVIAGMNADNVGASIDQLIVSIRTFLLLVCAALFVLLLWVESLTMRSIRRLRKGVDAVSAGNYAVDINVSSGDEVENLAHAFTSMADTIRSNTQQITDVSSSYYRFVPQNLVQLLGETSIEKVGKSSYVEKHMAVMTLHFAFEDESVQRSTGELFRNINDVIETLSPVVRSSGGTVYNFNPDGLIAVFERGSEALQAALHIRESAMELNRQRKERGMCAVDVRVVLCGGDVMLGIVGDETRMAPTVISDVIATSARLGELQRPSSVYILATKDIVEGARFFRMRRLGVTEVLDEDIEIYDVYDGDPYALLKLKEQMQPQFEEALATYEAGDMAQARLRFMAIVKTAFDDGVSRNYLYCADSALNGQRVRGYHVM